MHPCLAAMAEWPQWICWELRPKRDGSEGFAKVPIDPSIPVGTTGRAVDPTDFTVWMTAAEAVAAAVEHSVGVGFVFTASDPFFFLDLDGCVGEDGQADELSAKLLSRLPGAAVEHSISGRGLHVFGRCDGLFEHAKKNPPLRLELYTELRFVALGASVTGRGLVEGDSGTDCTEAIEAIALEYFPQSERHPDFAGWTDSPCEGYRSVLDDDGIIAAALRKKTASQVFGNKASFEALWTADEDELAEAFPPQGEGKDAFDHSGSDLSLAAHLAFWTGRDCERIERLMRRSALLRDKWDDRDGWLVNTILVACSTYYGSVMGEGGDPVEAPSAVGALVDTEGGASVEPFGEPEIRTGRQLLFPDHQQEYFKGCVALPSMNRVHVPGFGLLQKTGFGMVYDGPSFVLSFEQGAKSVRSSWDAFTGSETNVTPWAHGIAFVPEGPRFVEQDGERLVNIWEQIPIARTQGDASRFVAHVKAMLPEGDDAEILTSYLAACVQYPGQKFAWCPIVQGVQGNGKSTIAECCERAIGRRYVHQGKESQLKKDFNSWMSGSILVVIDDIKITSKRAAVMERIKPIITQSRVSVELKGVDAKTIDVCCNFILNTNHKDALPLTRDERRFATFYCAQQHLEDLARDGFTDAYFASMRAWLKAGGYAVVAEYLHTYPIRDEWNPSAEGLCGRAPRTSSHVESLHESMSTECQFIEAAVGQEVQGFRGGWVSTVELRKLFRENHVAASPRAFGRFLQSLGYVKHPAFRDGRAPRSVPEEGGRPMLYAKLGSLSLNEADPGRALDLYCRAQAYHTVSAAAVG